MAKMSADACRNSVRMPDGQFRSVPSASEVGNYMRLSHRTFPDGTTRLSFSLRGVWTICLNRDYFPKWSGRMLARLDERPGSYFREPGKNGDVIVDAAEVAAVAGESTSRRMRTAMTLVRDAVVADLVRSGMRSEILAILALTNDAARTRRIQEVLGTPPWPAADARPAASEAGGTGEALVEDAEEEPAGQDLDRFVPVVEREVDGRMVLSVVARDVWTFVGAGR